MRRQGMIWYVRLEAMKRVRGRPDGAGDDDDMGTYKKLHSLK